MIPRPDIKGMAVRNYNKVTLFNRSVYLFTMAFLNQEINNKVKFWILYIIGAINITNSSEKTNIKDILSIL